MNTTVFLVETGIGTKCPKWARTALLSNKRVFVPAALFGPELIVYLCAMHDGDVSLSFEEHLYVETEWAKHNYKDTFMKNPGLDITIENIRNANE